MHFFPSSSVYLAWDIPDVVVWTSLICEARPARCGPLSVIKWRPMPVICGQRRQVSFRLRVIWLRRRIYKAPEAPFLFPSAAAQLLTLPFTCDPSIDLYIFNHVRPYSSCLERVHRDCIAYGNGDGMSGTETQPHRRLGEKAFTNYEVRHEPGLPERHKVMMFGIMRPSKFSHD